MRFLVWLPHLLLVLARWPVPGGTWGPRAPSCLGRYHILESSKHAEFSFTFSSAVRSGRAARRGARKGPRRRARRRRGSGQGQVELCTGGQGSEALAGIFVTRNCLVRNFVVHDAYGISQCQRDPLLLCGECGTQRVHLAKLGEVAAHVLLVICTSGLKWQTLASAV